MRKYKASAADNTIIFALLFFPLQSSSQIEKCDPLECNSIAAKQILWLYISYTISG